MRSLTDVLYAYRGGQTIDHMTFTRSGTVGSRRQIGGTVEAANAANVLRTHWTEVSGTWRAGTLIEGASTNLVADSDDLTQWTSGGTPIATAAAFSLGDLDLTQIEDDNAGGGEQKRRDVTFTGDDVKAVSFFVRSPSTPSDGANNLVRLRDSTVAANRLNVAFDWSANGTINNVTVNTGTLIDSELWGEAGAYPVYRIRCQTTSVTAGNTNRIEVYPAGTGANVGVMVIGGVQAEDAAFPSSYIQTSGGTAARAADALTDTLNFGVQDLTIYGRIFRPAFADLSGDIGDECWVLLLSGLVPQLTIFFEDTARDLKARIGLASSVDAVQAIPAGDVIEFAAQFDNLDTGGQVRLDVGSGFGSFSTGATAFTAFGDTTIDIGAGSSPVRALNGSIEIIKVASGLRTLSEMASLPTQVGV